MEQVNTKVKKWGNSLGIILPKSLVDAENIKEGLEINIRIQPRNKMTVGDLFTFAKTTKLAKIKKSTDKIMREIDKQLWPE